MVCTTLNVTEAAEPPNVVDVSYGFAEVEFTNRMFQDPCEENNIIGYREAVGLKFTVTGADVHPYADIRFTVNYLRPGEIVKTSWSAIFTLASGTHEKFIYHTDLKYKKGQYTGLTLGIDFLK
jgi:hypothetical protein